MPTALKSIILFLLLTLNLSILTTFVKAADPMPTPEPITKANYTAEIHSTYSMDNIANSGLCLLAGMSPVGKCPGRQREGNVTKIVLYDQVPGGGAVGSLTNTMTALLVNPPTSTTQYLATIGQDLGFYKPVYAQGVAGSGAGIIAPVMALWQVVRNITYLFFIVIFIAVGFMIMFRQKLNPQTIITAQAALPGLVIGLILVTFSYFITALLVDLSFVGIRLLTELFIQVKASNGTDVLNAFGNEAGLRTLARDSNIMHLFATPAIKFAPQTAADILGGGYNFTLDFGTGAVLTSIITGILGLAIGLIAGPGGAIAGAALGTVVGAGTGVAVGPIVLSLLVPLVLIIALFIQFFKLLFKLITAYISILVSTILAPFIILFSSIPGRGGVLSVWWKTVLGNSLIFPAVFGAFLFAGLILATPVESWRAAPPLFGGLSTELLRLIIAYGILLGSPAIPDMVKKALGVADIQGIPQAALGGAMAGIGVGRNMTTRGWQSTGIPQQRTAYTEAVNKRRATGSAPPKPLYRSGWRDWIPRRIVTGH